MSSNVEKLLHSRLKNDTSIGALVSSRIYPVVAPQNADQPYIVYSRTGTTPINSSVEGYTGTALANITISSWDETYQGAKALADVVRASIGTWRNQGSDPKIDGSSIVNESDAVLTPEEGNDLPEAYGVIHEIDLSFEES